MADDHQERLCHGRGANVLVSTNRLRHIDIIKILNATCIDFPRCMGTVATKPTSMDKCESATTGLPPSPPPQSPLLRSSDITISWDDIELSEGVIDWSSLETSVSNARSAGGVLTVLFWSGASWAPSWIYKANSTPGYTRPAVDILASSDGSRHCQKNTKCVPNYLDSTFQGLLQSRHCALATKLRSLDALGSVVVAFQPSIGSTGDDTPLHLNNNYKVVNQTALTMICGNSKCSKRSGVDWWSNYTRSFAHNLATKQELFGRETSAGNFALLLNVQGASWGLDVVARNFPGSFLKFGQTGHEYQSNFERYRAAQYAPYIYTLQTPLPPVSSFWRSAKVLRPIRSRAELSSETCWTSNGPYFTPAKCPVKGNFLAMTRWVAAAHLDYWNIQPSSIASIDTSFNPLWRFLNRYSGLRFPQQREARGVWIAFRDGLDASDTVRFPESEYGKFQGNESRAPGSKDNVARAVAICTAHKAQGCQIDSEETLGGGPMSQRRQIGMNDVAFGNWRGDYANFITRVEGPNGPATRGWWRVGSGFMAGTSFFGRFARGWSDPTDPNATLALRIDRGMWGGLPLSGPTTGVSQIGNLTLRLVFLDRGIGRFSICYNSANGYAIDVPVKKTGSGEWKEICFVMQHPAFSSQGPRGADVWFTNDDMLDDIFDSLEISQESWSEIAMAGCNWNQ